MYDRQKACSGQFTTNKPIQTTFDRINSCRSPKPPQSSPNSPGVWYVRLAPEKLRNTVSYTESTMDHFNSTQMDSEEIWKEKVCLVKKRCNHAKWLKKHAYDPPICLLNPAESNPLNIYIYTYLFIYVYLGGLFLLVPPQFSKDKIPL